VLGNGDKEGMPWYDDITEVITRIQYHRVVVTGSVCPTSSQYILHRKYRKLKILLISQFHRRSTFTHQVLLSLCLSIKGLDNQAQKLNYQLNQYPKKALIVNLEW
jgi:hypothetical protein